jgi:hypothetical protein
MRDATLSKKTPEAYAECHYSDSHLSCMYFKSDMLIVVMLNVIQLGDVIQSITSGECHCHLC